MVTAVISDIHGEFERLQKVMTQLNGIKPEDVYVLGDMIQWGTSFPENRCLELIRQRGFNAIGGNHEDLSLKMRKILKDEKKRSIMETSIWPENIKYLEGLAPYMSKNGFMFAHMIPPNTGIRISNLDHAKVAFDYLSESHPDVQVCFVAHYHNPICFYYDPKKAKYGEECRQQFRLHPERKYIINPGSVGKRETGSFLFFEPSTKTVQRGALS